MATVRVPLARAPVTGRFWVPPSKSLHQRALALAVLADGTSTLVADGEPAGDVRRFADALAALVGRPVPLSGAVEGGFTGGALGTSRASISVDLGLNATGLRLAVVLAGSRPAGARTLLRGAAPLIARPHRPLLSALGVLGGHARKKPSGSIRVLALPWTSHEVSIAADVSSQFATALAVGATRQGGLTLRLVGEAVSEGYLRLTVGLLGAFGVNASREGELLHVPGCAPAAARIEVEPDASSAAVWWAAAALTKGAASVPGLPASSSQPDVALLPVLERMGARVTHDASGAAVVKGPDGPLLGAGDVDLRGAPDLAPLVGALAAGASGETRVVRTPHLRHKESDRVEAVVRAVRALGGDADESPDGFVIRGRTLRGGAVDAAGDHRLALAFGVLGLATPDVEILGAEAVSKSFPGFWEVLAKATGGAFAVGSPPPP